MLYALSPYNNNDNDNDDDDDKSDVMNLVRWLRATKTQSR